MKDFASVRRYTFYQEYGNGSQEDEPDGESVDYEDYKQLLEAYEDTKEELQCILERL
jgi:hypothetical protein